jgi:hypothetical protein
LSVASSHATKTATPNQTIAFHEGTSPFVEAEVTSAICEVSVARPAVAIPHARPAFHVTSSTGMR